MEVLSETFTDVLNRELEKHWALATLLMAQQTNKWKNYREKGSVKIFFASKWMPTDNESNRRDPFQSTSKLFLLVIKFVQVV